MYWDLCPLIISGDDEFDDIPESTGEFQCAFNEFPSNVAQAKQWELHMIMGRPQGESAPLKLSSINEKHDTWLPVDWHTRFIVVELEGAWRCACFSGKLKILTDIAVKMNNSITY